MFRALKKKFKEILYTKINNIFERINREMAMRKAAAAIDLPPLKDMEIDEASKEAMQIDYTAPNSSPFLFAKRNATSTEEPENTKRKCVRFNR